MTRSGTGQPKYSKAAQAKRTSRNLLLALCVTGLSLMGVTWTQSAVAQNALPGLKDLTKGAARNSFVQTAPISLKQATVIAREHTGGRVLSANTRQRAGVVEHRIRMLVNGERVVTLTVDAEGQVRNRR